MFLRKNKFEYYIFLIVLVLVGLILFNGSIQAQEAALTFQEEGELLLTGTPNSELTVPLTVVSGETDVKGISFSLDSLFDPEHPNDTLNGTSVAFSLNSFDLPPKTPRTVLFSIPDLPGRPGTYQGDLEVRFNNGEILKRPVTLEVAYAALEIAATDPLPIQGQSGNLQETLWLAAPDGDVKGISLVADQLRNSENQEVLNPADVSLKEGVIDLQQGDRRLVTIQVNGEDILPGTYEGQVHLVQQNQLLDEAQVLNIVITVLAAPTVSLPQGETNVVQLIRPLNSVDNLLTRWLMPPDYRQQGLSFQVKNDGLGPVHLNSIQSAITRYGTVNSTGTVELLTPITPTMTIPAGETAVVGLNVPEGKILPGAYKGTITMFLTDSSSSLHSQIKQNIQVDLSIRQGPAWALLLLILGLLFGRIVHVSQSEQVKLLGNYYKKARQLKEFEDDIAPEFQQDLQRIQQDGEAIRNAIYDGENSEMENSLTSWGERPEKLRVFITNIPKISEACQNEGLIQEDCELLEKTATGIRQKIHTDDNLNVQTRLSTLIQSAPSLKRLRELEQESVGANLDKVDSDFFSSQIQASRSNLLKGDLELAKENYENLVKALKILPEIKKTKEDAKKVYSNDTLALLLIELQLETVHQDILQFHFEQVNQRLLQIKASISAQTQEDDEPEKMGGDNIRDIIKNVQIPQIDAGAKTLRSFVESLTNVIDYWQVPSFLGEQPSMKQPAPLPKRSNWQTFKNWLLARTKGFVSNLKPELGLRLGRPLVWFITVILLVFVGFQTFYVSQGITFGADPLTDYLTLFLWGFTSDVSGSTVSSLADKFISNSSNS